VRAGPPVQAIVPAGDTSQRATAPPEPPQQGQERPYHDEVEAGGQKLQRVAAAFAAETTPRAPPPTRSTDLGAPDASSFTTPPAMASP
jgi:hypothetical protein